MLTREEIKLLNPCPNCQIEADEAMLRIEAAKKRGETPSQQDLDDSLTDCDKIYDKIRDLNESITEAETKQEEEKNAYKNECDVKQHEEDRWRLLSYRSRILSNAAREFDEKSVTIRRDVSPIISILKKLRDNEATERDKCNKKLNQAVRGGALYKKEIAKQKDLIESLEDQKRKLKKFICKKIEETSLTNLQSDYKRFDEYSIDDLLYGDEEANIERTENYNDDSDEGRGERNILLRYNERTGNHEVEDNLSGIPGWSPTVSDNPTEEDATLLFQLLISALDDSKGEHSLPIGDKTKYLRLSIMKRFLICSQPAEIDARLCIRGGFSAHALSVCMVALKKNVVGHFQNHNLPQKYVESLLRRKLQRYLTALQFLLKINIKDISGTNKNKKLIIDEKKFIERCGVSFHFYTRELDVLRSVVSWANGNKNKYRKYGNLRLGLQSLKKQYPKTYKKDIYDAVCKYEIQIMLQSWIQNRKVPLDIKQKWDKLQGRPIGKKAEKPSENYKRFKNIWFGVLEADLGVGEENELLEIYRESLISK